MATKRIRFVQRRKVAGFTQEGLAEHLGVERSTVGRWETAETEPQVWLRPKLARALKVTGEELQGILSDVTALQARPSERMNFALENPASTDMVVAAHLHERVRRLDESYDQSSSTSLLGPAGQTHGQVKFLRENASNPRVRRALYEIEADSATLMGQLVWDVSQRRDQHAPLTYFGEAVEAARHVRDPSIESYATLRMSFVALYGEKSPQRGVTLAQRAAEVAKVASPSLTGLSLLHVAEGHAMKGALKECEDALRKADAQFDRVGPDDVAAQYYTVNEFNRLSGSCYLFLDLPERAEPILRTTTRALAAKKKSQVIALGNLTLALIRQGKLDEAAATMHRTIDAVELTRGWGGLNLAFSAGRELRQWRNEPWAQDINDRLLALMATT
ncbi:MULTISPECIES: helix-turn-helix transcriptional regulator [unclassified Streptomyces]|uniref:helix-turn-helix transcriptional regulator n=1 Tax=unclassified Streptomyces TaxID=2593676 RepID=UPI00081ED108|nr:MULTISPECIES: helix-turn-helix transcriptional regulator [unclassified Streptomyces]MYZ37721.1 helix-turn-helix domain-containing protein [Streptomyces sp. SID4917]SCF93503.1 DNA-binding transcriptional regulator, XRE-family HTH domain [Streptomyces sp. MnatMP-M17]